MGQESKMSDDLVLCDVTENVAVVTMNRPKALNALSDAMLAALSETLTRIAGDQDIKAVILRGAGKVFCAGHDLKEMQAGRTSADKGAAYFNDLFARCGELMQLIPTLPQPVIAQVHGIATAAGCQLVATCDMAVAASDARFGVNGVNIGLFCSTPMVALTRNLPRKQAFEMLTTGEFISAEQANNVGLINRVATPDDLESETMALAKTVASKLSAAVQIGKRAFYEQINLPVDQAYAYTGSVMAENMLLKDTDEGINAFIEKRKPGWAQ